MAKGLLKVALEMSLKGSKTVVSGLNKTASAAGRVAQGTGRMATSSDGGAKSLGRMASSGGRASKSMGMLKKALAPLMVMMTVVAGMSLFKSMLGESDQFQRNMLRTEALVRATGQAAGFTAKQLRGQAQDLALGTLQSVEGVEKAQQILLTFRSVSGDAFTRATETAADLATVTGTSLTSAMTQLGKALEDPVQGVTALRRVGVMFTDQQQETLKSLVATNQTAEAQKLILDELARQYGGVARAEAEGYAGALDTLSQKWQELKLAIEESGGVLDFATGLISGAAGYINELTAMIASGEIGYYLRAIGGQFVDLYNDIQWAIDAAGTLIREAFEYWGVSGGKAVDFIIDAFLSLPRNIKTMVQLAAVEILVLVDKAAAYGRAIGAALDPSNWFGGMGEVSAELDRDLAAIGGARSAQIDEILAGYDRGVAKFKIAKLAGKEAREEWERNQRAIDNYTPSTRVVETKVKPAKADVGLELSAEGIYTDFQRFTQGLSLTDDVMTEATAGLQLYNREVDSLPGKLSAVGASSSTMFDEMTNAVTGWANSFSSQLNEVFWGADLTFSSILESFGKMLSQMVIQKQIIEPLLGFGMNFLSGLGGGAAMSTAGSAGFTSSVSASSFSFMSKHTGGPISTGDRPMLVPRFHFGGLMPDEIPIVAQTGERMLSREQNKTFERLAALLDGSSNSGGSSGTEVHIHNNGDNKVTAKQSQGPGGKPILDIMIDAVESAMNQGRLDRSMATNFGMSRAGTQR